MSLSVAPLVPLWLVITLASIGLLIALATIIARRRGGFLRLAATALMALALLNPSVVREEREKLKDVVVVLVDRSGSQALSVRPQQTDALKAELSTKLGREKDLELRVIDVGEAASADGTRLFGALQTALSDVPSDRVAGAILITDGVVHDIPVDPAALGFRAPVNALITGYRGERDRRIELLDAPRFGLVGKELTLRFRVLDAGRNEPVRINLRRDGQPIGTRLVVPGETIRQQVKIEHGGANVFEIDVDPALAVRYAPFEAPSRFPQVRRDLAFIVDDNVTAGAIMDVVESVKLSGFRHLFVFDVYRGANIESGRKSIALGLILQDKDRTLTDDETDLIVAQVREALRAACGAVFRE